jgi:hypothetical protein
MVAFNSELGLWDVGKVASIQKNLCANRRLKSLTPTVYRSKLNLNHRWHALEQSQDFPKSCPLDKAQ